MPFRLIVFIRDEYPWHVNPGHVVAVLLVWLVCFFLHFSLLLSFLITWFLSRRRPVSTG